MAKKTGNGGPGMKNMMKVLIVDDDEALAGLIKKIIEKMGTYRVKTAVNGEEGYELFLHFKPDIILTDIQMPAKNGLEMVRDIRNHDPGIKTIYMSGNMRRFRTRLEEEKTKYKASLLDKPFSFSKLTGLFHEYQKERR
ncbi:MAG: response regulator [Deltaproteobacteria bacterium]|nr:response regulator [Deltaproteobacteria bacterium]MBW2166188.1 response regulator [Deltaproteobacteria bacterium]